MIRTRATPRVRATAAKIEFEPGILRRLVALPFLLLVSLLVSDDKPRNRFDGDNFGGNDGGLKRYDDLTDVEHDEIGGNNGW